MMSSLSEETALLLVIYRLRWSHTARMIMSDLIRGQPVNTEVFSNYYNAASVPFYRLPRSQLSFYVARVLKATLELHPSAQVGGRTSLAD